MKWIPESSAFFSTIFTFIMLHSACGGKNYFPESFLYLMIPENPPVILKSVPDPAVKILPEGTSISILFDRDMDHKSVESSFTLTGPGQPEGIFRWESAKLIYELKEPPVPGGSYILNLNGNASSAKGIKMEKEYIVHFTSGSSSDFPEIISSFPAGSETDIDLDSEIQVIFTKPMNPNAVQKSFNLSPHKDGTFLWNGDFTVLTFQPNLPFDHAVMYNVRISTEAEDHQGIFLQKNFNLTFQTGTDFTPPFISSLHVQGNPAALEAGSTVSRNASFLIKFSEKMDYSSVPSCTEMIQSDSRSSVKGILFWDSLFQTLTFTPEIPLSPESKYELFVSTCARDLSGLHLEKDYILPFQTNPDYLKILSAESIYPLSETITLSSDFSQPSNPVSTDNGNLEILVHFSHTVDAGSIPSNINLNRKIDRLPEGPHAFFTSILPGTFKGFPDTTVLISISGLSPADEYALEFIGGRNGILSSYNLQESPVWMQQNPIIFITVN
ncbi:MAG: Ig-like domain-containing protein [Spirochaetia bacterium]|nr:Ig-like domain-containing protein [Spirochaetia bacterium]